MKKNILILFSIALFLSCSTTESLIKKDKNFSEINSKEQKTEKIQDKLKKEEILKLNKDIVAVVGKYKLTREKYNIIKKYMKERYDYKLTPEQEKEFIIFIINKKLMAMEARKENYHKRKDLMIKYEWDFDDILSHAFYEDNVEKKSKVTTKEAKEYYKMHKEDFIEIKLQHILVKNKKLAKNLYERIIKGEDFSELAKKYSEDTTTKSNGGIIGYVTKGFLVKELEDAAFSLSKDEVSEPVKTIYGYHILKVLDKRKISFDKSKDKIVKLIQKKKKKQIFKNLLNSLKKKYPVKINEEFYK